MAQRLTTHDHPAAGGDDLDTGVSAHVNSEDSDNNPADKEDNALAMTVCQPTPIAR